MNFSAEREKIIKEIENIPENKLEEIFRLVHNYRMDQESTGLEIKRNSNSFMEFAGSWEDMPEEVFNNFLEDISIRRREAFSARRER